MSLAAAWILFPALLLALSTGCGLLIERLTAVRLPGALVPVTGLALIVVCGQFLTLSDATAELTAPVAVALAVAGISLGWRGLIGRVDIWAAGAALAAFAAFAAPIVLSGEATFAGYIKLDDTATWMALTDRVMESGRDLEGLAPSTYEATLAFNLADGYPVGVFLPLGVATLLSGQDVAWTIQPYMAMLGVILALGLWQIAGSLLASRPLRAAVAFAGSQAALLYGFYLWGGIKEIAAAAMLASAVPVATFAVARRGEPRALMALAVLCAAMIGMLSPGGAVWLGVPLAGALALLAVEAGLRRALGAAAWCGGLIVVLSLPVLFGGLVPPTSEPLTDAVELGNLIAPLDPLQVGGIWPSGDFRLEPPDLVPAQVLIAVAALAALGLLALAVRERRWEAPLYVGGALIACIAIYAVGSPWVDGKALAIASPAIPFAACLGAGGLYAAGRRVEGAVLLLVVVGGVLWSNALQYRDVDLAPRDQLAELEEIGEMIAGQGPALMTEYQPYGARHFLREADAEGASELRRRIVPLAGGGSLAPGEYADTDRLDFAELLVYRTLVLRRGPHQSRPGAPYSLSWEGDYYEVWQRSPDAPSTVGRHLGLGGRADPVGQPSCTEVRRLADLAGPRGTLLAASRPENVVVSLANAEYPQAWRTGTPSQPIPTGPGQLRATVEISRPGAYRVWLAGSVRPEVELRIDGVPAGVVRHQLNNRGLYTELGGAVLEPGRHEVIAEFHAADLHPGSGGLAREIGPLVLSDSDAARALVVEVSSDDAEARLCGVAWDWIEAEPG